MSKLLSRRMALSLFTTTALLAFAPSALATDEAENYVEKIGKDVLRLANAGSRGKATRAKFATLLSKYVNLRGITLASLGTYQKQLPPGDKEKLNDLVTTYAAALFAWYVEDFKGEDFVVDRTAQQGKFLLVYSKIIKSGGSDEPIVWYLSPAGSGYRIVDISVLGVRLSSAMRQRFNDELKKSKGDFEPLYAMLREAETW
ncbi:MAG: ABC transporter substrate-binding protein [Phyllobacteriaceae bacterium]|jgi:ABC-type transporter MlaC component|nr:ABC transporter substrate-binding protein [Phyllobacteriaceae bacterium]